jgi:hypothetical protein
MTIRPTSGWGSLANYNTKQTRTFGNNGWGAYAIWPPAPTVTTAPTTEPTAPVTPLPPTTDPTVSAMDYLRKFFANIGLQMDAELEGVLLGAMKAGYTPADIQSGILMPDIQKTQAFQKRFPGYSQRVSNGYNAISIGEYLQLEDAYRSVMANAGLPSGFYDDPSDMGQWIAKNVSVAEIESRVRMATDMAKSIDPTMRNLMARFYGLSTGDVAAYYLDPTRALPEIEKQYKTAGVASWAARNGYEITDMARYQSLVEAGITPEQAGQAYGTIRQFDQTLGKVAGIYGETYDQGDAEQDVFFNKNEKRRRLASFEQATFSGSSRGATGSAQRSGSY